MGVGWGWDGRWRWGWEVREVELEKRVTRIRGWGRGCCCGGWDGMGWDGDSTGLEELEGVGMMGYLMNS